jgi:hypothetical protein
MPDLTHRIQDLRAFAELANSGRWCVSDEPEPCIGWHYDVDNAIDKSGRFATRGRSKDQSALVMDLEWLLTDGTKIALFELRRDVYRMLADLPGPTCFVREDVGHGSLDYFAIVGDKRLGHSTRFHVVGEAAEAIIEHIERSRRQRLCPDSSR